MPETKGAKTEPTPIERHEATKHAAPERKVAVNEGNVVQGNEKQEAAKANEEVVEQRAQSAREEQNAAAAKANAKVEVTEVPLTWTEMAEEGTEIAAVEARHGGQGAGGEFVTGEVVVTSDPQDGAGIPPAGTRPWVMSEPHNMGRRGNHTVAGYVSPDCVEW